jgi:hypothetical protein
MYHFIRNEPDIFSLVKDEMIPFNKELVPFNYGRTFNQSALSVTFQKLCEKILDEKYLKRPVFVTPDVRQIMAFNRKEITRQTEIILLKGNLHPVPDLFGYRIIRSDTVPGYVRGISIPRKEIRFFERDKDYDTFIRTMVSKTAFERAEYELNFGKDARADSLVDFGIRNNPRWQTGFPEVLRKFVN